MAAKNELEYSSKAECSRLLKVLDSKHTQAFLLACITRLNSQKQSPTQAQQSPSSSALVHCIGEFTKDAESKLVASQLTPQLREIRLLPGDQILLCSDGLPDYSGIDEADAEEKMKKCVEESFNVHHAAFELISLANRGGGGDNLSCIVLKFTADQEHY